MGLFRKDDPSAVKELDKDLKILEEKVKNCDESVVDEFLWFGSRYTMYEHDKELEYETASNYHTKAKRLSDIFESKCKCKQR